MLLSTSTAVACPVCGHDAADRKGFVVSLEDNAAYVDGMTIQLGGKQAELMFVLAENSPRAVTRETLMGELYIHYADEPDQSIIGVFVCALRRKLAGTSYMIMTVWGKGYRLCRRDEAWRFPIGYRHHEPHRGGEGSGL